MKSISRFQKGETARHLDTAVKGKGEGCFVSALQGQPSGVGALEEIASCV